MKKTVMKAAMRVMKKKAVSKIARGKLAKAVVFQGKKEKTKGGFCKADLLKNKRGKVVTKAKHAAGKKSFVTIAPWNEALMKARKELGIKGFCPVGGKSAQGKALYAKTKALVEA
mmetsp:Transcript_24118/g.55942  ORF Transcript_24118/g.55942 Transcript_24118/m.55942 type:complete len:115 (-) Transcript_24118:206-550(-)